jgi:hypothetical protein
VVRAFATPHPARSSPFALELTLLLGAVLALLAAGEDALAAVVASAVVLNAVLLSAFGQ